MIFKDTNRRDFLKVGSAALAATAVSWNARSYAAILGANDRVRVGVVGCGDRMKGALLPAFLQHSKELNFEFVAVSDIWNRRRDEGSALLQKLTGNPIASVRNNDELYARKDVDAVLIATADFQHAQHGIEAVNAGRDAYVEKPTAHTMEDARKSGTDELNLLIAEGYHPQWLPRAGSTDTRHNFAAECGWSARHDDCRRRGTGYEIVRDAGDGEPFGHVGQRLRPHQIERGNRPASGPRQQQRHGRSRFPVVE